MTDYTKEDHDLIVEIHTVLLGTNGQGGLCRQVDKNTRTIFKIWCAIIAILVSIGGSTFGIVKLIGG
uniref:Uncharacterized protein n=1 Tax=viral metagenome TaxID=1070528 RepID=A0A6M3LGW5_9ZZZZ